MALYRFLFAPVLLAVAVLTSSPRRAPQPQPPAPPVRSTPVETGPTAPARPSERESRVRGSHPGSVR